MKTITRNETLEVDKQLIEIKEELLFTNNDLGAPALKAIDSIGQNPKRPLGKFSPWAWCLEPVRGCNLKCWHCPVSIDEKLQNKYEFMSEEIWTSIFTLIKKLNPYCRVEMANIGEPTLHPNLLEYIAIARSISPNSQIQITTNGTQLYKGKITYDQIFKAGANIVYVDMYAPEEKHAELAEQSGYDFYSYYNAPKNAPNAWTFHNDPDLKFISLSRPPDKWPKGKIARGALGTFANSINFDSPSAAKLGITPVVKAPQRRCNQPQKYVQIKQNGTYLFCCQDVFDEADLKTNVKDGMEGFFGFWLGKYMQDTRKSLNIKDRRSHPICKRCDIIFNRCDMKLWDEELFDIK